LCLLVVICGALVGLIAFARVLRWLIYNYHDYTIAVLIGLIIGALRKVWPWKESIGVNSGASDELAYVLEKNLLPTTLSTDVVLAILLMVLGFILVLILNNLAARRQEIDQEMVD
jgi:putative membrane protein